MAKVAVLDDWQGLARSSADWSPLMARAEVVFFAQAFADEDDAAAKLQDFELVLSMRERTPLPASLINRLPKLRMLGITGVRNASLDTAACAARGVLVCNTVGGVTSRDATAELALGLLLAAVRGIPAADANIRAGRFQEGLPVGVVSLEGYLAAKVLCAGLEKAGQDLTSEHLVGALESIQDLDFGIGTKVSFGPSEHQGSHKVWATAIDSHGRFRSLDLD
jgi:hypothetical protein